MSYGNGAILHVVDRVSGGVPVAVGTYIRNSPQRYSHHVLSPFVHGAPAPVWDDIPAIHHDLGVGTVRRIRVIRRTAASIGAVAVHAHSSYSGAYARLSQSRHARPIIYTPHCYAFERTDLPRAVRFAYRVAESALAWNTTMVAACSYGEHQLADHIPGTTRPPLVIPNAPSLPVSLRPREATMPTRFGMAGRVSRQKDPRAFLEAAERIQRVFPDAKARWIGSGDEFLASLLRERGVHVTGWKDGAALTEELDQLDLYLHVAAWEGFPLAVLDAHARRRPILVRPIRAFTGIDPALTLDAGLRELDRVGNEGYAAWADENVALWAAFLAQNTPSAQRRALARTWSLS